MRHPVTDLALFLASDDSAYITGEVFCISGGSYVRGSVRWMIAHTKRKEKAGTPDGVSRRAMP